jgi:hypothetical protein
VLFGLLPDVPCGVTRAVTAASPPHSYPILDGTRIS